MRSAYAAMISERRTQSERDNGKAQVMLLQKSSEKVLLLIERAAAEPMGAEATFQLALCKHEQAERLSRAHGHDSAEREAVLDAWKSADGWWANFSTQYKSVPPSQLAHANAMRKIAHAEVERIATAPKTDVPPP
jgi:hypothetical protein